MEVLDLCDSFLIWVSTSRSNPCKTYYFSFPSYELPLQRKKGDIVIGLLSLLDITVLIAVSTYQTTGDWNYAVYAFDTVVVSFIIFSFCRRLKESHQWKKYLIGNWYEIIGMIPIVFFAIAGYIADDFDGFVTLGIILRLLAILYLVKLSRSIEDKSRIFGNRAVLQIFILFFLTLTVSSFLFYKAELPDANSEITTMGDAIWWTLQTATTSTFGPNVTSTEGRVLGGIIMIVGIGITGAFISTLASGLTRSRTSTSSEEDPKKILQLRLAKGEITKETYVDLLRMFSE
jgi:voltage-gated potassium channel